MGENGAMLSVVYKALWEPFRVGEGKEGEGGTPGNTCYCVLTREELIYYVEYVRWLSGVL